MSQSGPSNLRQLSSDELAEVTRGFHNENRLGRGGQGVVFRGSLSHRNVAVKRIELGDSKGLPDVAELEEVARKSQYFEELKYLNSLRHPHVVNLEAWGIHTRQSREVTTIYGCIVMEFMAGGSLQDRLFGATDSRPMSSRDRIRIAAEMSVALLEMHLRNYWHLDLKPDNVLLDAHGTSKLCDLGLARFSEDQASVRVTADGTPGYYCPAWNQHRELSKKTDLYALGLVFLQLLTGRRIASLHHLIAECEGDITGTAGAQKLGSRWHKNLAYARDKVLAALDRVPWSTVAGQQVAEGVGAVQARGLAEIALRCVERLPKLRPTIKEVAQVCQKLLAENAPLGGFDALYRQGLGCFQGDTVTPQNHGKAIRLFRLAAEGGHAAAQWRLGKCYAEGTGVLQDWNEAVRLYRLAAAQGLADGQAALGACYKKGHGVQVDYVGAARLYGLAAAQGHAGGQVSLGTCYIYGRGVQQDYAEALRLYGLAAAKGEACGHNGLGFCYRHGHGVQQDYAEAVRLYRLAAAQGEASGQCNLGHCYQHGHGVQQDKVEAVRLYRLAAAQGEASGQCNLGHCYQHGHGVQQDKVEAVRLFRLAAAQGFAVAQCNLGFCYQHGHGVQQNKVEAVRLYGLAAAQGFAARPVPPGPLLSLWAWRAAGLCGGCETVQAGGGTGVCGRPVPPGPLL